MPRLFAYLTVAALFFAGYHWWTTPSVPAPASPPSASLITTGSSVQPVPQNVALSDSALPSVQPASPKISQPLGKTRVFIPDSPYAMDLTQIDQLLEVGKDDEAERKLAALSPEALADPAVKTAVANLWKNLGAFRGHTGGAVAALPPYKRAVAVNPFDHAARLTLVLLYRELNDPALTTEFMDESVRLFPDDPYLHLFMVELLLNKDDLQGAKTHLGHAAERKPDDPQFQNLLQFLTARIAREQKSEQKFVVRDSSHFTVKFDGDEDHAVWSRVAEILEDAYRDISQQLGHFPGKPIVVVLHTRETFQSATGGPAWSDGLYDPMFNRIKIPTQGALTDQVWLTRVLRHEFVHALLHDRMGDRRAVPTWLNEGLAMQLAGDPPPDIPGLVHGQITLINLSQLEGGWMGLNKQQALVAYLEGNSATKYFIDRFGMSKVREVLDLMAGGQTIGEALQDRLFISYDDFQRRWVDELNDKIKSGRT